MKRVLLAGAAVLALTSPAWAAVDLTDTVNSLISLGVTAIIGAATAAIAWLAPILRGVLGAQSTGKLNAILLGAIHRAMAWAVNKYAPADGKITVDVGNAIVESIVEYILGQFPDMLKRNRITPENIRNMVERELAAKMGVQVADLTFVKEGFEREYKGVEGLS